ncbi:MAG TPA: tautomerase family protein [Hyphomicrobiaceae bacterium]|nr:tautomerase family protein [Hyphomicrobiaceae bacterium]
MPSTRITTGAWARGQESAVIEAVQAGLETGLKIPDWDRDVVLDIRGDGTRIVPTGRSDHYTRVEIALFSGRSLEAKRRLYSAIVENLSKLGVPKTEIKIILVEVPPENWGIRGGIPASEIDLGFDIKV